ncbi:5'-3' exoribonuclease 1 [Anthonomus grandis grandis]|uniref:5'-3' exoribonuclease 1 n=1 Tax=Anthonomus grandis grandis TaxID=2921223 RepID=UPI0021668B29|nr:5'-3' exoribonuclease 1 [Anthonomus grandis grandis]
MGVPKFFRYISERYPCLSELVREYQLPEFDNMYLDMNGIIHMCSHPDDNNPHFRITEEKIFEDIFHYLEVLFRMIRPQKLFFMAIDGVAPRAKMNQQRGRRFRTAKDAEKQELEAKKKGEVLPTEDRFDSNCITPGTVFMARLHEQLKYFCVDKISNDPLWKNVKIILSGHETPGEGEHKIMDYIRYIRSQPGYDPNTRHCLYGLDADLIMLGLCTHEPHFSLLREEVKFGKKSTKRQSVPEEITFFLLHLSLMREYLEMEFSPLKDKLTKFEFDLENIIDDWVLMGFLVGNDFIPHLPNLHIANGALPILYKAYMEVLPTLDGYINEGGELNLSRFEKFMQKLANFDLENFEEIREDLEYMSAKTGRKTTAHSKVSTLRDLEEWASNENGTEYETLEPEGNVAPKTRNSDLEALIRSTDELDVESDYESEDDEEDLAFKNYKKEYYMNKLEYSNVTPEVLRAQAEGYVRAIQWNLHYYYNGCCSWSWYYPHHYAPYISDIKHFTDFKIDFDPGRPFKPYEQLLAVLPVASKGLLPQPYHRLMTDDSSIISKYYPEEFQTDKNGKRQEWEAVVLIPFMDEKLLLDAMSPCNDELTPEEVKRNTHGPMLQYTHTEEDRGEYQPPDYRSPIRRTRCKIEPITIESLQVPKDKLVKGKYPGALTDIYYPGFPTLKHLKFTSELQKGKVKVFEQPSRYENMTIKLIYDEIDEDDIPVELLGENVFINWPHMIEGRVVAITNSKIRYISMGGSNQYNTEEITDRSLLRAQSAGVIERYKNRLGIEVGPVKILCHVQVMTGRKYVFSPNGRLTLEKQFSDMTACYPLQTVVSNIASYDSHMSLFRNLQDVFPEGATCFTLSHPYYGAQGIVVDSKEATKTGRVKVCVAITEEPNFDSIKALKEEVVRSYKTLNTVSSQLGMSHFIYSRMTGSVFVQMPDGEGGFKSINVGLDLKFNRKNKETPGYTKKFATTWYYTDKCTDLLREYADKFPEIFIYFSSNGFNDDVKAEQIFSDDWDVKMKELQVFLKTLPTFTLERQSCDSQVMEPEIVAEIEKIVDNQPKKPSKKVTMTIKPSFLYKPELQSGTLPPDPNTEVLLLDRIVNTRKGFSVPFGLKGTVIAISESPEKTNRDTMYDVVFDKPFKDGMQLNCSPGRGYRLPITAFINISYGLRVYQAKTGKDIKLEQNQPKAWQNTNGQKFFNQFMQQPTYRKIPDQYYYQQRGLNAGDSTNRESAFASFGQGKSEETAGNNSPKNLFEPQFMRRDVGKIPNREESWRSECKPVDSQRSQGAVKKMGDFSGNEDTRIRDNNVTAIKPQFMRRAEKKNEVDNGVSKEVWREIPTEIKRNTRETNKIPPMPMKVDTDFLNKLLKVGSTEEQNKNDVSGTTSKVEPPAPQISKIEPEGANVSFEMLAKKVAETSANIQLLTYFQANGLGVPRYSYSKTADNKYKAQLTLPSGEIFYSDSADTKEEATEKAAAEVLRLLMKRASNPPSLQPSENVPKAVLHNPFVPTQVLKRQASKTSDCNSSSGSSAPNVTGHSQNKAGEAKETKNQQKRTHQKPQQKKWRIAANFNMK